MTRGQPGKVGPGGRIRAIGPPNDPHYTVPLYKKVEAAHIIDIPPSTLRNWAAGPSRQRDHATGGFGKEGLITVAAPATPRGPTIPFIGLTEAYVLASFREAGVPMQRIRPAIRRLEQEIGEASTGERAPSDRRSRGSLRLRTAHRRPGGEGCRKRLGGSAQRATSFSADREGLPTPRHLS